MSKTYKTLLFAFGLLLLSSITTYGQKVSFTVDAPNRVEHNAQFRITFTSNSDGDFAGPTFDDFQLLGGPSTSSQTSMSIVNGRTTKNSTKAYTYYLRAVNLGTFRIPSARITVDNKVYKTAELKIEVVKSVNVKNASPQITNPDFKAEGRVFIKSIVSNRNVYLGQPITLTQKLYSVEAIANITDFKEPTLTGFYKENIDIGDLKLSNEVINGVKYSVVVLKKSILFPQKSGNLEISNFDLDVVLKIIQKRKARDRMEQMMYGNVVQYYEHKTIKLKSPKVNITVKELPKNKPADFNGIVGNFDMTATIDKQVLKSNDALNLKIVLRGKGNIGLLDAPKINFPPDFEIYDPKISKNIKRTSTGISGSKTYEYIIIAGNEGDFVIPSFGFSYFNPSSQKYEQCLSKDIPVKVLRGEGGIASSSTGGAVSRDEIKYVGKDIHHIQLNEGDVFTKGKYSFNSLSHFLIMLISPILAILLIIGLKKRGVKQSNKSLMRLKKATKMAKKRLKSASIALKSNDEVIFYEETSKALWGYLADKFAIDLSDLSMDKVKTNLQHKNVPEDQIIEITGLIQRCEFARYAPSEENKGIEDVYTRSIDVISRIEKTLK